MGTRNRANSVQMDQIKNEIKECLKESDFLETLAEKVSQIVIQHVNKDIEELKRKFKRLEDENKGIITENQQMQEEITAMTQKCDNLEQYSRRNNLRIFGLPETMDGKLEDEVLHLFNTQLNLQIKREDIDRVHRLGRTGNTNKRNGKVGRPLIVRFANYKSRRTVFEQKKMLKGTGIVIREDLCQGRLDLYKKAIDKFSYNNVWTVDGKICFKYKNLTKYVTTENELTEFTE